MSDRDELLSAAVTAAAALQAVYEWLDQIDKAGGATSVSGVAKCHAMLNSLRANRPRMDRMVVAPLRAAIEAEK